MYIGYFGTVIFGVAEHYLVTPDDVERSGEARWQTHDVILKSLCRSSSARDRKSYRLNSIS